MSPVLIALWFFCGLFASFVALDVAKQGLRWWSVLLFLVSLLCYARAVGVYS